MSPNELSPDSSDPTFEEIKEVLSEIDSYIVMLARKYAPYTNLHPNMRYLEIDEIAQRVRIKLWRSLQKRQILNLRAYVRKIAHSEVVDTIRRSRPFIPLNFDEDGELYHGDSVMFCGDSSIQDPALAVEEKEMLYTHIKQAIENTVALPHRQRQAMEQALKEEIADILPIIEDALSQLPSDIATELDALFEYAEPLNADEQQLLRASLSVVRRKFRAERKKGTFDF